MAASEERRLAELFSEVVRHASGVREGQEAALADQLKSLTEGISEDHGRLVRGTVMAGLRVAAVEQRDARLGFQQQRALLTAAGLLVDAGKIDVWCLVDVFTGILTTMSESVLNEQRAAVRELVEQMFARPNHGKNMKLKIVQAFIEAMDRIHSPSLRGFLSIVLTNALPPEDQSGRNQKGKVHVENKTVYQTSTDNSALVGDAAAETLIDWKLYKSLWSLQDYLSNPPTIESNVPIVRNSIEIVLDSIESAQVHPKPPASWLWLNKKYLTSPHLLMREISNPVFQRQILTQMLFALTPLSTQTPLWKPDPDWTPSVAWRPLLDRIRKCLEGTYPSGSPQLGMALEMIKRDQDWAAWKSGVPDGYKAIAPVSLTGGNHRRLGKRKAFERDATPSTALIQPGSASEPIAKMWCPAADPLRTLVGPERSFVPSLEEQFAVLREEKENTLMDEEDKSKSDRTFVWKLLRLARQEDVQKAFAVSASVDLDELL